MPETPTLEQTQAALVEAKQEITELTNKNEDLAKQLEEATNKFEVAQRGNEEGADLVADLEKNVLTLQAEVKRLNDVNAARLTAQAAEVRGERPAAPAPSPANTPLAPRHGDHGKP